MKKVGSFSPSDIEGVDYLGEMQTREGKKRIKVWCGRDGNFHDYFKIYGAGDAIQCIKQTMTDTEYTGNTDRNGKLWRVIIKPSDPTEKLPMFFDIFVEEITA